MDQVLEYLTNAKIMELAGDNRVLFGAGVLFVLALVFRWKFVLLLLFAFGGTVTIVRYANMGAGGNVSIDQNLLIFGLGTVVVAGVLIYFLFIRSD